VIDPPLGDPIDWIGARVPSKQELAGRTVTLRPLDPGVDVKSLFPISHEPSGDPSIWTYLPYGPYRDRREMEEQMEVEAAGEDPLWFSIVPAAYGQAMGRATYLRIDPANGSIEIGHIWLGAQLRRTTAATEAIFLLARHAFEDLGYRRLEWKCNALNKASTRAALRFGFQFEGLFRNHRVVKGRNRDTAWFSIIDSEWPSLAAAYEGFLAPENFDADGGQRQSLGRLIRANKRTD
jgi:RimJ/RimL family protein N-acetyltransferase